MRKNIVLCALLISFLLTAGISASIVKANEGANESILQMYDFPNIQEFSEINADLQSVDQDLYNFQFWARRDGLYFYFVQYTNPIKTSTNQWENTHVELEIWNECFGYGWNGTYVALFLDGSMYLNNAYDVIGYHYEVKESQLTDDLTKIEYYLVIEFYNSPKSGETPYAYVKQYQYMPGVTPINSQIVIRDNRTLITGDEKSFQVHNVIDAKMYT